MSTATLSPARTTLPPADRPIPLTRMIAVECRKLVDTRAGRALLIVIVALTAVAIGLSLVLSASNDFELTYQTLLNTVVLPTALLLPVLGILSVTSEWSQRTHMVTFTLQPHRARVVAAKLATGVVVAVLTTLLAMGLSALAYLLYAQLEIGPVDWSFPLAAALGFTAVQVLGLLTGFAFGMLLLNTPAAIVSFVGYAYVMPVVFSLLLNLSPSADRVLQWIDFARAQSPLSAGQMNAEAWGHLAVSGSIWFLLPLVLGLVRMLRAEVK